MNEDGAVNAKAEVFLRAFKYAEVPTVAAADTTPTFAPIPGTRAHEDIARARKNGTVDAKETIAIGILRKKGADDRPPETKLGVFIQHKKLRDHPVVREALRIVHDDARIIVTGRVRKQAQAIVHAIRPLRSGISVGHHRVTAGTIGCFGIDREGRIGVVSNNHVLAHTNRGRIGDIILQPGPADGGVAASGAHTVATLTDYVPIDFDPAAANLVDCAFAVLGDGQSCIPHTIMPNDADADAPSWPVGPIEDLILPTSEVRKVGRTTNVTYGIVEATDVDNVRVQMVTGPRPKFAMFNRQVAISGTDKTFSKGGDSGALICMANGRPAALLFAGTETGGRNGRGITYANPIRTVLDALEIELHASVAGV